MKREKLNRPIKKGIAKVPVIMQLEALECGAASLAMVLAYFGKWVSLEQVRLDCGVSRDGSNARNILRAARNYGLTANGYKLEPEVLKQEGVFPCIIHWEFNHFVVCKGIKGNKVYINDPARGEVVLDFETFDMGFTGIAIFFDLTDEFEPGGEKKSVYSFAKKRLKGAGGAVAFVTATSLITSLISMINPVFSRVFIDRLLSGQNPEWGNILLIVMAGFAVVQLSVCLINEIYSLKINAKLSIVGNTSYMWKVLRLPMEFFSQRMAGDIQMRQFDNAEIASSIVNTFAPLIFDAFMMIFYIGVMLRYNIVLSLIGIGSIIINLLFSKYISGKRVNISRVLMRDSGKLSSATVSGIEMIETIKASGAEDGYFEKWAGYQASVNSQNVKFNKLNQYLGILPEIVSSLMNTVVLIMGILFIINGNFTIGLLVAFQGFLSSFTSPAMTLITAGESFQEMRGQMERIEDVMEYPIDEMLEERDEEPETYAKLSGELEMRNVTFGYARLDNPLIENFNLKLKPGSRVAFVGSSGCGKSTMSKLISGLYKPWSGEILFDGKPINEIDRNIFTGSLAVVDQDITIFEDTIANNIKMWDTSIEDFEMIMAARDAQIHEDIMLRDGGYQYRLTEGGKDFSGGQKQRLEIARVLAQDPTIIIMDEATSALDAKTEYEVVKSIKNRGVTCIVVAHRLSTIRDCDEIIVLDHGKVVERGTHDELFAKGGYYSELISNE